jgi:hypothetical protein
VVLEPELEPELSGFFPPRRFKFKCKFKCGEPTPPVPPPHQIQYFTLHPYGRLVATLTGFPAIDSSSAART